MFREHWRELDFWRWLWHVRIPVEAKGALGMLFLCLALGGGWLAADRLSTANASISPVGTSSYVSTVERVVTVREQGRVVRKLIPVIRTIYRTTTSRVTVRGQDRTIRTTVTLRVPLVEKKVVTVAGKSKTVATTVLQPTTNVITSVVTQPVTVTVVSTAPRTKGKTETVTVTQPVTSVQTVTVTTTKPAVTITVP